MIVTNCNSGQAIAVREHQFRNIVDPFIGWARLFPPEQPFRRLWSIIWLQFLLPLFLNARFPNVRLDPI